MSLRDASPAKGQACKPGGPNRVSVGATKIPNCPGDNKGKGGVPRTLATRKPRS